MFKRLAAAAAAGVLALGLYAAPASATIDWARHHVPGQPTASSGRLLAGPYYFYAGGREQFTAPNKPNLYAANLTVDNPSIVEGNGNHTLAELAVQDGPSNGNIIEIGWIKVAGDSAPKLFVFSWRNNIPRGYNACTGCGWHDYNGGGFNVGDSLSSWLGTSKVFGWTYDNPGGVTGQGKWWAWTDVVNGGQLKWIGWFEENDWYANGYGEFKDAALLQNFGEVTTDATVPCTEMGKGIFPVLTPSIQGAKFGSINYARNGSNWPTYSQTLYRTNAAYYDIVSASDRTKVYGGPGGC